ncbi:MAG: hypothetical protein Q4B82_06885 [Alysiella sp.]|nr:hypothetical protein [Alysiella sp.]
MMMFYLWKNKLGFHLPDSYEEFLSCVKEEDGLDYYDDFGNGGYFYGYKNLLERNATYDVQKNAPDYFLIGQDGDLGFFIHKKGYDDAIYALDLGALGSAKMHHIADNMADLLTKILSNEDENWDLFDDED